MPYINPKLAYSNIFEGATLADDPAGNPPASGYPLANMLDWRTWTHWKPGTNALAGFSTTIASTTVNYFGWAGHSQNDGTTIQLQYYNAGWQNAISPMYIDVGRVGFTTFPDITATQWRVQVTAGTSAAPWFGVIAAGQYHSVLAPVSLPFTAPPWALADEIATSISDNGEFVGRSRLRDLRKFNINFDLLHPDYIRGVGSYAGAGLSEWINHARLKPFFFAWNTDKDFVSAGGVSTEAAYCWIDGPMPAIPYDRPTFQRISVPCVGYAREPGAA